MAVVRREKMILDEKFVEKEVLEEVNRELAKNRNEVREKSRMVEQYAV